MDLFNYARRETSQVMIGATPLGGSCPVRIQSMTNTPTTDTEACVEQAKRIVDAGGEYVRLTTQGVREAENLRNINAQLRSQGYNVPLVADVHFNPRVADVAALYAEKVRINPGNYVDAARTFRQLEYTDEEYQAEIRKIRDRFVPFLRICKENRTAIRIGVNHGSLSDRIMSRYGDTPRGMVESCMEFLRICVEERFADVVVSIKASNTIVMVHTVRLLAATMEHEGMAFPLHLGVTEAGEGEDGRIKSALGIGALLYDGLGDTIRVSLSEAPEAEIPVARKLADHVASKSGHLFIPGQAAPGFDYLSPQRRVTRPVRNIGGSQPPVVIAERMDGVYGVAIGRGAVANPQIFAGERKLTRYEVILRHLAYGEEYFGERYIFTSLRSFLPFYLKGVPDIKRIKRQIDRYVDEEGQMHFDYYFVDWPTHGKPDEYAGVRAVNIMAAKRAVSAAEELKEEFPEAKHLLGKLLKKEMRAESAKQIIALKYFAEGELREEEKRADSVSFVAVRIVCDLLVYSSLPHILDGYKFV